MTTLIRNAAWAVTWDEAAGRHMYARDVDIAFEGDRLTHVGSDFAGEAARIIDGGRLMVMPGLVNVHSHPLSEPMNQGFTDDLGSAGLYQSSLYEYMPLHRPDLEGMRACAEKALAELLLSGVTTLVDLSVPYEGWTDIHRRSGIRSVLAPMYRSARWFTRNGHVVEYEWEADRGEGAMAAAMAVLDEAARDGGGLMQGMVAPSQIDTCDEGLLRESLEEARRRGLPLQIHAAQSVVEFHEITRRHGMTPIQWLERIGLLGPSSIIGHCIFLDDHPWAHWTPSGDLARLRDSGAAVAHCPVVFCRRGVTLRSFGRYLREGLRVGVGTDTYPHNMLEEMRAAVILSRVATGFVSDVTTGQALDAATIHGAAMLGRDDIGRLAVDAKADLVLVDLDRPQMQPCRDPLKSLIHVAAERAVRDVFVAGRQVVEDGRCLTLDLADASARVHAAQARAEAEVPALDYAGRDHWTMAPPVVPFAEGAP